MTALEKIASGPRFGSGLGIARCRALLKHISVDPTAIRTVGITGSNGKGSTATMLSALLTAAGMRTGLYTSPHFLDPKERFRVNGKMIGDDELEATAATVLDAANQVGRELDESFARFELLTATTWLYFQNQRVEIAVLEAGIGGRYDTTRLARSKLTAITSLDLEHRDILGESLELIFADKLDLATRGGTCFAALPPDEKLRLHCKSWADEQGVRLLLLDELWPRLRYLENDGRGYLQLAPDLAALTLPMRGEWQARNAALAIAIGCEITSLPHAIIEQAFSDVTVPGRFETVLSSPEVVVDAAHTPDAIRQVVHQILQTQGDVSPIVLVGISQNKPVEEMVEQLAKIPARFFVTASPHGGADPNHISALFINRGARVEVCSVDLAKTVDLARAQALAGGETIYALGGLFFAADVCRIVRGGRPEDAMYL